MHNHTSAVTLNGPQVFVLTVKHRKRAILTAVQYTKKLSLPTDSKKGEMHL